MKKTKGFCPSSRYTYDFDLCHFKKGWAQIDTYQDAPYFGVWANPFTLKIFTYCEGDLILEEYETPREFKQGILKAIRFYDTMAGVLPLDYQYNSETHGQRTMIDGMCQENIIDAFRKLGLGGFLH